MVEVDLWAVTEGPEGPVVLLRQDERVLPILINYPEASSIQRALLNEKFARPLTHDLICNLLAGLRGTLKSVTIYKLENGTYFAHLNIEQVTIDGDVEQVLRVDTRPSDGMALAARAKCPIYVSEDVLDAQAQDVSIHGTTEEEGGEPDSDPGFDE
jgi:uncharacterized protein